MGILSSEASNEPLTLIAVVVAVPIAFIVAKLIRDAYFGPLSHIPGPKLTAVSRVPYIRHLIAGSVDKYFKALHEQYGSVVRISPNEVSFTSGDSAWAEIYGFRTGKMKGHVNMQKDPVWYPKPINGTPSILIANDEDHSRGRRLLSHAFSEKALAEQEQLIQKYVDQLVDGVYETTQKTKKPVDVNAWYNWTTFDVINDLTFGEPLGCLQNQSTHKYIELLANSVLSFRFGYVMTYFPWFKRFGSYFVDKDFMKKRIDFFNWVQSQTTKRLERETERPDFTTHTLKHNGEKGLTLSKEEMVSNNGLFLTAGSETTATTLCAVTYLLLTNPAKLQKLTDEVRGRWASYDDITLEQVNSSPYLLAVLSEAMRYFPPVPAGFQRQVGVGGETVSGYYIPQGTGVSVSHQAMYHSPENFKDPDLFVPERWMGDSAYDGDHKSILQPFSFGPRACLGRSLAYAEMRLVLAKMVWAYDMELHASSRDWMNRCELKTLWHKPQLLVDLRKVVRD